MMNNDQITPEFLEKKIPCRVYYKGKRGLILTTSCNYAEWHVLSDLVPENVYIIYHDWSYFYHLPADRWLKFVGENKNNFIFLSGETTTHNKRRSVGLLSYQIPHNTFINSDVFNINDERGPLIYNAALTARAKDWKRIWLAKEIDELALIINRWKIDGHRGNNCDSYRGLNYRYLNSTAVSKQHIARIYNQSYCGLIFSDREGGCYTSSEYLLCGLPVISTKPEPGAELGGREFWYTDENAMLCDPDPLDIKQAFLELKNKKIDRPSIRRTHIDQMNKLKTILVEDILTPLFHKLNEKVAASDYFYSHEFNENAARHMILAEGQFKTISEVLKIFQSEN